MKKIQIKVNMNVGSDHAIGKTYDVDADDEGTPIDFFWRRLLKNAELDGCCEIVKPAPKKVAKASVVSAETEEK